MRRIRLPVCLFLTFLLLLGTQCVTFAIGFNENPYITMSPDGQAFTTEDGQLFPYRYPLNTMVYTGQTSGIQEIKEGQHLYKGPKKGMIPVEAWKVTYPNGKCIHYNGDCLQFHGLSFRRYFCGYYYSSGWMAVCADCGEMINRLTYMSKECAASLSEMPGGMDYYYLCPKCRNLEQGRSDNHICYNISSNRYKVRYKANASGVTGSMEDTLFMYDNVKEYEGHTVETTDRLSPNAFTREGYVFAGWNTEKDGSGIGFQNQAVVKNLTCENWTDGESQGIVTLYAMWVEDCDPRQWDAETPEQLWLEAELTKKNPPYNNSYKRGETGVLKITTGDYVQTITIDMPSEFDQVNPNIDRVITLDPLQKESRVTVDIVIPPSMKPRTNLEIQICAIKNGEKISKTLTLTVLDGAGYLSKVRTRLR